jgi:preprotein translocase subunit SecA
MDRRGVGEIIKRSAALRELSDAELSRVADPAEAFAVAAEAARRVSGAPVTADRLTAAVVLPAGDTAEGDVVLAAVASAVAGRIVHILTGTDDQARRHAMLARPIGELLGLSVGLVVSDLDKQGREAAYRADITCGPAEEVGFDYLRDNLAWEPTDPVQRGLDQAFVSGAAHNLAEFMVTGQVEGSTVMLGRITAWGLIRRYRAVGGAGELESHPMALAYEDVWDAQIREFYERRQRILHSADAAELGQLIGTPAYAERCKELEQTAGPGVIPEFTRTVLLSIYDASWRDQLAGMAGLRERTKPRAFPKEAAKLYRAMWASIERQAIEAFFNVRVGKA